MSNASASTGWPHRDIAEATEAELALRESEARFRQFGEASSDVLWIRSAETLELEYLSSAFERIYGMSCEDMLRQPELDSWIRLIEPEDRHSVYAAISDVHAGKRATVEYRIRRPGDGRVRWMRNTKFPLLDENGVVVRIGGIGHDATEEREASDRLQVLVAELQHRTRNLIAVVSSIAERTLHECASLDEFRETYSSRLAAIARVQGLLSRLNDGDKVSFDDLLREELKAHGARLDQVDLQGPSGIKLRSTTLQTFALALHELATNAIKYGALSVEGGRLSVHWDDCPWEDGTPALCVEWREQGVRCAGTRSDRPGGYGRELIERALPYQLKARTLYELQPEGLYCSIQVPLVAV